MSRSPLVESPSEKADVSRVVAAVTAVDTLTFFPLNMYLPLEAEVAAGLAEAEVTAGVAEVAEAVTMVSAATVVLADDLEGFLQTALAEHK